MRQGMVIDLERCIGCHACEVACEFENGTPPGIAWTRVFMREDGGFPDTRRFFMPTLCMHCKHPACVEVCPTGASYQREDGVVLVDHDKCIGCKACMIACPYDARYFDEGGDYPGMPALTERPGGESNKLIGTVEKCTFCVHRLEKGEEPVCVIVCPTVARVFGDLDNPESAVSRLIKERHGFQIHEELGREPSVYYLSAKSIMLESSPQKDRV